MIRIINNAKGLIRTSLALLLSLYNIIIFVDVCCVTLMLISNCVTYPNKNKSDGDKCFNSNRIINGGHRLSMLLSFFT